MRIAHVTASLCGLPERVAQFHQKVENQVVQSCKQCILFMSELVHEEAYRGGVKAKPSSPLCNINCLVWREASASLSERALQSQHAG